MPRPNLRFLLFAVLLTAVSSHAQYKGTHLPGLIGLQAGTQAPPGIYVGDIVFVYDTSTLKGDSGRQVNLNGGITTSADIILVNWVTNYKLLGGNVGGSAGFPFMKNRLQLNSFDAATNLAYTDMFISPLTLGWHFKRTDLMVGYNLYIPTGKFKPSGVNTGLGMYGHELSLGTTVFLDKKRMWHAAGNFALEFHTHKRGEDITVGDLGTIEGGIGRTFYKKLDGPIPLVSNLGLVGYSQFKVTGDNGRDIPLPLRGLKDRAFALGPEFNIFIPKPRLSLLARWEPEFGARNRTQGQTFVFSIVWVAKSFERQPNP